ncbi:MAG: transcriptional regulator [Verrucomicrobiota bacterium]
MATKQQARLQAAKDEFVTQWGAIGNSWGVNRTMAQIHALLMVTPDPMSTDQVMEELKISRGNANMNLRELVGWGLIRSIVRKGERKEFFEAEKDVWKIFCIVTRERKRREIDPVQDVLHRCQDQTAGLKGTEAETFQKQIKELSDFVATTSRIMDKVASSQQSKIVPLASKLFK